MVAHKRGQNKRDFVVVGIDPALKNLGFAVNSGGSILTMVFKEHEKTGGARLASHRRQLKQYLGVYRPQLVAVEGYSHDSVHRAFDMGEIGGVIRCLLAEMEIPYLDVAPKTLKKFVTGSGAADKDKVIKYANKYYGIKTDDDNAADAAGLAKFAEVWVTRSSLRRCELEGIKSYEEKRRKKKNPSFGSLKGV